MASYYIIYIIHIKGESHKCVSCLSVESGVFRQDVWVVGGDDPAHGRRHRHTLRTGTEADLVHIHIYRYIDRYIDIYI
jgi:hypothetical protein